MTLAPHIPTLDSRSAQPRSLEIRWAAVRASEGRPTRIALVVIVRTLDAKRALLDAWLEDEKGTRDSIVRQPAACRVVCDGELVHIDVPSSDRDAPPWLAVSLVEGDGPLELLYARSGLLALANLRPGAYDPPRARMLTEETGAASA